MSQSAVMRTPVPSFIWNKPAHGRSTAYPHTFCKRRWRARYVFRSGQPSDRIHAVAGQIMECTRLGVGIEIPAVGRLPELVRMGGDDADDLTEISV